MGTHAIKTKKIIDLLAKEVFICFDQDINNAGLSGTMSVSNVLKEYKIKHRMVVLPREDGKNDVAKYFKTHTVQEFKNLLDNSIVVDKFKAKKTSQDILTVDGSEKIICPFHGDNKPSLVIYYKTKSYYCFGCGKYGPISEIT